MLVELPSLEILDPGTCRLKGMSLSGTPSSAECLLERGMPWAIEVNPHSKERGLVQGKLYGCYVCLSPGSPDSRVHSLIHLLLLPKP